MNWYYADGSKQVGPITETDFENLIRSGVIKPETLVWREGLPNWQPCREAYSGSVVPSPDLPPIMPPVTSASAGMSIEQVTAREYSVDIGDCLNRSWEQYKNNFGITLGATVLVFAVVMACGMLPFGTGAIAQLILTGPLMGGLYLFYLRLSRGQTAGINDAFSGFGPRFKNLMLTHLVTALLSALAFIPAIALFVVWFFRNFSSFREFSHGQSHWSGVTFGPVFFLAIVLAVVGMCVSWYLSTCWIFALPLAADKAMGYGQAMRLSRQIVRKHWWATFGFVLVAGLIGVAGIVACFVGIIFTMPITVGMIMYLYKRNFDDLTPTPGSNV